MSSKPAPGRIISTQRGFTLLEMLLVISLLAAVAFVAGGTFLGVREQTNDQLVHTEMQEIAKAIRRFKQDTGYYPKTGPFRLKIDGGEVANDGLPEHVRTLSDVEKRRWFYSPANFYQLLTAISPLKRPQSEPEHQLAQWNPETGRGWRGPYLQGYGDGFVVIRDGINNVTTPTAGNPAGNPLTGINIPDVEGIADPFEHRTAKDGGDTLLGWSARPGPNRAERSVWGRPYLVFDLNARPRIVSMGPDGVYGTPDDIELHVE